MFYDKHNYKENRIVNIILYFIKLFSVLINKITKKYNDQDFLIKKIYMNRQNN